MLQEDLNATSHSTEELIEERQILNSVLIQQVSQPWKTQQQEDIRQNSGCVIFTRRRRLSRSLSLCTFLQSSCEMFTQQLLLHSSDERFSEREKKQKKKTNSSGYKSVFESTELQTGAYGLTLTVCSGLDMWWLCLPPPPGVCWHDVDILVPTK